MPEGEPALVAAGAPGLRCCFHRHTFRQAYPKIPSIQIVPTFGSKVYKEYLLWAVWSLRHRALGLGFRAWASGYCMPARLGYSRQILDSTLGAMTIQ